MWKNKVNMSKKIEDKRKEVEDMLALASSKGWTVFTDDFGNYTINTKIKNPEWKFYDNDPRTWD